MSGVGLVLVAAGTEVGFSPCRLHPPWFASASAGIGFRACIGVCFRAV